MKRTQLVSFADENRWGMDLAGNLILNRSGSLQNSAYLVTFPDNNCARLGSASGPVALSGAPTGIRTNAADSPGHSPLLSPHFALRSPQPDLTSRIEPW